MKDAKIVGIMLIRNEDVFVRDALTNITDFCDRIIVADNYSTDNTWPIVQELANASAKIECLQIRRTGDSHALIKGYAGTNTWLFGVDGDEIYDPVGLNSFRRELLDGQFDSNWTIFGNVLNCTNLDRRNRLATGYLAPPCRSMTKLYNFSAITSWEGEFVERMLGGSPVFKPGYSADLRLNLHEQVPWDNSHYRCLHTCFLRRSSEEKGGAITRRNPVEINREGLLGKLGLGFLQRRDAETPADWKFEKYMRGDKVTLDVSRFFPVPEGASIISNDDYISNTSN